MAEDSKIEWTTHTFNPWRGCTKVSAGCAHCYAETLSGRNPKTLGVWGPKGTRVVLAESGWRDALKWNAKAEAAGERHRVFCASLADVFEDWSGPIIDHRGFTLFRDAAAESDSGPRWTTDPNARPLTMDDVRERLFFLIRDTPALDWLLLTKRPDNILPTFGRLDVCDVPEAFPNVWLGASVENQAAADARIPHLLATPAAVRFLSCEPLLSEVELTRCWLKDRTGFWNALDGRLTAKATGVNGHPDFWVETEKPIAGAVNWVIVGGESGHNSRPMQIEWARALVRQCQEAGVACFVKQLGATPTGDYYDDRAEYEEQRGVEWPDPIGWNPRDGQPPVGSRVALPLVSKKGGDPEEWPADLRVRQFPAVAG